MKKSFAWMGAALASLCIVAVSENASASSHREAPAISRDPAADNTDFWAWVSNPGDSATLHLVASYNPFEEPAGGPNFHTFADDVLYEIHVSRGDSLADVVTYQFRFKTTKPAVVNPGPTPLDPGAAVPPNPADMNGFHLSGVEFFSQLTGASQTYSVTAVKGGVSTVIATDLPVAPPNIGPRTSSIVYKALYPQNTNGVYDEAFMDSFAKPTMGGGMSWAGPTDDGFYVDLGGAFDLANFHSLIMNDTPKDNVAGYNVHTIALDVPVANIPAADAATDPKDKNLLGTWASASRRKVRILRNDGSEQGVGPWVQVSRLGIPLINELMIGLQDKDKYNRTYPSQDLGNFAGYFLNPTIVRDAQTVGIYTALGVADATVDTLKTGRLDIVATINLNDIPAKDAHVVPLTSTGDVLRLDFGTASGFPNGRPIISGAPTNKEPADVTDVLATVVLSGGTIPISDGVSSNDKPYRSKIPYLALPWEGFSEGHGQAAP
jgi:hypothetical protein